MKPATRALLLLLWVAGLGCATDYTERYRLEHPGWTPAPPSAGDSLGETLASIQARSDGPNQVSVGELRVLRVDVEPWETIAVDSSVAGSDAQIIGAIAQRRCRGRRGIHFFGSERVSWYIFVTGELASYDHFEFGEACEPENHYVPSSVEQLATERALIRYAARRYPESTPTTAEMLSKGMALVSADRLSDAEKMLRGADRDLDFMTAKGQTLPEEEREAFQEKEKQLRVKRARLSRAIAAARRQQREAED